MKTSSYGLLAAVLVLSAMTVTAMASPVLIYDIQEVSATATGLTITNGGHNISWNASTNNVGKRITFRVYGLVRDLDNSQAPVDPTGSGPISDPAVTAANALGDTLNSYTPSLYLGNDGISTLRYSILGAGSGVVGNLTGGTPIAAIWAGNSASGTNTVDLNGNGGKDIGTLSATASSGAQVTDVKPVTDGSNATLGPAPGYGYFMESPLTKNVTVADDGSGNNTADMTLGSADPNVTSVTVAGVRYTRFLLDTETFSITAAAAGTGVITLMPQTGDSSNHFQKFMSDGVAYDVLGNDAGVDSTSNFITMSVVPEPATMALIGMGAMGLLGLRRRRSA